MNFATQQAQLVAIVDKPAHASASVPLSIWWRFCLIRT